MINYHFNIEIFIYKNYENLANTLYYRLHALCYCLSALKNPMIDGAFSKTAPSISPAKTRCKQTFQVILLPIKK